MKTVVKQLLIFCVGHTAFKVTACSPVCSSNWNCCFFFFLITVLKRLTGTLSSIQDVSLSIEQEALQTFPCSEEGHDGSFACWAVARILGFPAYDDAMVRAGLTLLSKQFRLYSWPVKWKAVSPVFGDGLRSAVWSLVNRFNVFFFG